MTNKQIATAFSDLAKIMELHGENPFKIRSYSSAYLTLRKVEQPLIEMSDEDITALKGVGKTIAGKIRELNESGKMMTYEKYREMTPPGVVDMLKVNGFGPLEKLEKQFPKIQIAVVGDMIQLNPIVEHLDFLVAGAKEVEKVFDGKSLVFETRLILKILKRKK